jgi:hypothetical protein
MISIAVNAVKSCCCSAPAIGNPHTDFTCPPPPPPEITFSLCCGCCPTQVVDPLGAGHARWVGRYAVNASKWLCGAAVEP